MVFHVKKGKTVTISPSSDSKFDKDLSYSQLEPDQKEQEATSEELSFMQQCQQVLRQLGYISTQYEFSESFLNKNKFYFGMILSEGRRPSIDSINNLIKNISVLNCGDNFSISLENLHDKGEKILTRRLLHTFGG